MLNYFRKDKNEYRVASIRGVKFQKKSKNPNQGAWQIPRYRKNTLSGQEPLWSPVN